MSDRNKNKSSKPKTASAEPWEVEAIHRELPTNSRDDIERVVSQCKQEQSGLGDRKKVVKCVRRKFSS